MGASVPGQTAADVCHPIESTRGSPAYASGFSTYAFSRPIASSHSAAIASR